MELIGIAVALIVGLAILLGFVGLRAIMPICPGSKYR